MGFGLNLTEVALNQKLYGSKSWVNSLSLLFFLPTTAIPSWFEAEVLKHEHSTPSLMRHEKCRKICSVITELLPLREAWNSFQITLVTCAAPKARKLTS